MPVCQRYDGPLPLKMAHFNMPLQVQTPPDEEYLMEDHYHDNGMTSPHELGTWMDDQSDGGGKFRLKRRRRCGQCGPCQVKENCGKCQYCVRKDILKQACIYRKCVYLRKPVPRFRPESTTGSSGSSSGGGGGGVSGASSSSNASSSGNNNKGSPQKPSSTPSSAGTNHNPLANSHPTPSPFNPTAMAAAAELSSCQLTQNPFALPTVNNGVIDPLRAASALDPHRASALFDATGMLDPTRSSYLSSARSLESGRSPALDLGRNTNTADSGFGTGSSMTASPAGSTASKERSGQFRSPMEQWGAMPYGFPRASPWAHPALQPNAYGFQHSANHYANPFAASSSCRLSMADPAAATLASTGQASFHHNMPFARPDFSAAHAAANLRASAAGGAGMQAAAGMAPPFYPPPHHVPTSSLPNFPSFNQLPSSAGAPPHPSYTMGHPSMYPANFYTSFRPPNEPQIYHAHLSLPEAPLAAGPLPYPFSPLSPFLGDKPLSLDDVDKLGEKGSEEDEEDLKRKFSIFRIPRCRQFCDSNCDDDATTTAAQDLTNQAAGMGCKDGAELEERGGNVMLLKTVEAVNIDEDLDQQMKRVCGQVNCSVITIDDMKLPALIRSDGFNNLEIEVDSPAVQAALMKVCPPSSFGAQGDSSSSPLSKEDQEDWRRRDAGACDKPARDTAACRDNALLSHTHAAGDSNSNWAGKGDGAHHGQIPLQCRTQTESRGESSAAEALCESQTLTDWVGGVVPAVTGHAAVGREGRARSTSPPLSADVVSRTLPPDVVVCLRQEGEGGAVTELVVPGNQVQLEEVDIDQHILTTSSDPQDLLRFLSQHAPLPGADDLDLVFDFRRDDVDASENSDFDAEDTTLL